MNGGRPRRRTFSLRARLTVLLALAVLVVFGSAARIVDWRADAEMHQRFDATVLAEAQSLAALVQVEDGRARMDTDAAALAMFPGRTNSKWYVLTCGGRVIAHTPVMPPALAPGGTPRFANATLPDGHKLREVVLQFRAAVGDDDAKDARGAPVMTAGGPVCQLRYARNRGPLEELLHTLDFILLGSLLGACLLVLLVTPWLVQRGLRPLAVLDHAMAGIGPDAPGRRLPDTGTTELVPLVDRFNGVLERMDAGLARERQFASGLAHEFRTRLAELRMLVDVERRHPSGRDPDSLLGEVGTIGDELEATVTALLQLTRLQSGLERITLESMPLLPALERVCARHGQVAHARGVQIQLAPTVDDTFLVDADPALLEIVLDNLLGNAVAYAPRGTTVDVIATNDAVRVSNAAPQLAADDLARFGQRFWRKGEQGAGHAGLGLALADAAALALGMSLTFALDEGHLHASLHWRLP